MKTFEHNQLIGKEVEGHCAYLRDVEGVYYCIDSKHWYIWGRSDLPEKGAPGVQLMGIYCRFDYGGRKSCCRSQV